MQVKIWNEEGRAQRLLLEQYHHQQEQQQQTQQQMLLLLQNQQQAIMALSEKTAQKDKVWLEYYRYFKSKNKLTPGKGYLVCKCLCKLYTLCALQKYISANIKK